ncbi:DUF559 domain-containing protein [Cryobacterium sp. RTS3]|uniref:endonuclease domain-containing protein n=1 Tax=Cryobacterium sp. RTS3 TaxID=3048643 RepID=UPI002B231E58|nr:DUF559 domain-containing protein [Cryobacterium sp. RTS3]MEB0000139.1 DUF559 domain-containing protein [Cryobacterium sp. RTS3]
MTDAATVIRRVGGAASLRQLADAGLPRAQVLQAVSAGSIRRVRNGWFAVPEAPTDVVRAVRVGGTLTGASVARLHGLWLLPDRMLHVRVPATASRLRDPSDRSRQLEAEAHRVCVHYSRSPGTGRSRDPLVRALTEMFLCDPGDAAIVAVDSALNLRELAPGALAELSANLSPAQRTRLALVDGNSDSGLETLLRLFCVRQRMRVRTQVRIRGVGRVDLLVGERLVLELDGEGFHTGIEFENDRRRDFELVQLGYLVVRISYKMLLHDRERVEAGILALIRRDEHLWTASRVRPQPAPTRNAGPGAG